MRRFALVFNSETKTRQVIFRDIGDPPDEWYVFGGVEPITDRSSAQQIVDALNATSERGR